MCDQIKRLENWKTGSRSRAVSIEKQDGYGASCWEVVLRHEHGVTAAYEMQFTTFPIEKGGDEEYHRQCLAMGTVFVKRDEEHDDYPGLCATIDTAINAFEQGIWGTK